MKKAFIFLPLVCVLVLSCSGGQSLTKYSMKDAFQDKFMIGAALNQNHYKGSDVQAVKIVKKHFNTIVAENCMKSEKLQPAEGQFFFDDADQFIAFGLANNMFIVGHTLIWHSQAPAWFFVDDRGKDVTREVLIERMRNHITTVVTRYKGKVHGWDVVNEAILDDGSWRKSKFYEIIGEEYVKLAFEFAHQADPDAELYYNDYSMAHEGKRNGTISMVKELQKQGVRIDGIGMQGHMIMDFPTFDAFEQSIIAFSELGVKVMITELDLSILPSPNAAIGANIADTSDYEKKLNPYTNGLTEDVLKTWENRYHGFFSLFLKHHDKISRVTLWGVTDSDSWKNNWPVKGRTDYPLLFDRNYQPKPLVNKIIEEAAKYKGENLLVKGS
jgi:endo-1,4-beta-xylanase